MPADPAVSESRKRNNFSCIQHSAMREPNFFIVGAPKAGTTSLYHYLDQHPDIYMSPMKEPCHFSYEVRPENFEPSLRGRAIQLEKDVREYLRGPMDRKFSGGIVAEWSDYLRLFAAATTQQAVGEASVNYLMSRSAPGAIASRIPHARIIMVLRSPVERAFSQYLHFVSDGLVTQPFRDYVRTSLRHGGKGLGIHEPFLEMGFYAEQVQRYLEHFPREQIGIWLYEKAKSRPREFMREVLEFLEVDSTFTPDTSMRYNQPRIARMVKPSQVLRRLGLWKMFRRLTPAPIKSFVRNAVYRPTGSVTMEAADRRLMLDFYRGDIHRLEGILNRDLGTWLV
jgi:hypothetical protein